MRAFWRSLVLAMILVVGITAPGLADVLEGLTGYELGTDFTKTSWDPFDWPDHPDFKCYQSDINYDVSDTTSYPCTFVVGTRDGKVTMTCLLITDPSEDKADIIWPHIKSLFDNDGYTVSDDEIDSGGHGMIVYKDENGNAAEYTWRNDTLSIVYATGDEYDRLMATPSSSTTPTPVSEEAFVQRIIIGGGGWRLGETPTKDQLSAYDTFPDEEKGTQWYEDLETRKLGDDVRKVRQVLMILPDGSLGAVSVSFCEDPMEHKELDGDPKPTFGDLRQEILNEYPSSQINIDSRGGVDAKDIGAHDEELALIDSDGNWVRLFRDGNSVQAEYLTENASNYL